MCVPLRGWFSDRPLFCFLATVCAGRSSLRVSTKLRAQERNEKMMISSKAMIGFAMASALLTACPDPQPTPTLADHLSAGDTRLTMGTSGRVTESGSVHLQQRPVGVGHQYWEVDMRMSQSDAEYIYVSFGLENPSSDASSRSIAPGTYDMGNLTYGIWVGMPDGTAVSCGHASYQSPKAVGTSTLTIEKLEAPDVSLAPDANGNLNVWDQQFTAIGTFDLKCGLRAGEQDSMSGTFRLHLS